MIIKKTDKDSIERTVQVLKNGGITIIPTDTVYGFSGITTLPTDSHIRSIKGRSETKPLIQLIARPEDLLFYTNDKIPSQLLSKWPGALTIIVHIKEELPLAQTLQTVAFRCPGAAWLRAVIAGVGAPIFSTSVNRSGQPVLDTVCNIRNEFEKEVDLIVDDGDKKGALPSTLVSIEDGNVKVLRQGSVQI